MEYRLNKIDTDLRQKINDAAKEGLVHGSKNIAVNKDKQNSKKDKKDYKLAQNEKNKKLLVDAIKAENVEVVVYKEHAEIEDGKSKGYYLDVKK